jgi:hypothetical protein
MSSMFTPKSTTTPGAGAAPTGQRASIGRARPTAEAIKADNEERGFGTFTPTAGKFTATCEGLRKFTAGSGVEYEVLTFKTKSPNGNVDLFTPNETTFVGGVERFCRVLEILGVAVADDGSYDAEALKGVQCQVEIELKDGKARLKWSGDSVGVLPAA